MLSDAACASSAGTGHWSKPDQSREIDEDNGIPHARLAYASTPLEFSRTSLLGHIQGSRACPTRTTLRSCRAPGRQEDRDGDEQDAQEEMTDELERAHLTLCS